MSLPGLPPPRRTVLPVPPGGAARARAAGRGRRAATGAALAGAVLALGLVGQLRTDERLEGLEPAAPVPGQGGVPGRVAGRVVDQAGRPVPRVAVLPGDLSRVLTRTRPDGTFSVRCGPDLVLAAYAPSRDGAPPRERSPGAADVAWRRVAATDRCGERLEVVLRPGGAVEGRGEPGTDVQLRRAVGATDVVLPRGPVFATRVGPDGAWRVEGLDTGRYLLAGGVAVDVREGATVRVP